MSARRNPFSCQTCLMDGKKSEEKSGHRNWTANICLGHIGLFITAIAILIMQIMQ